MAAIILPHRWRQQPQGEVLLRPDDAIAAVLPAGGALRMINGPESVASLFGTGHVTSVGRGGVGVGFNAATTGSYRLAAASNRTDTVWEKPSAAFTLLLFCRRDAAPSGIVPIFSNGAPSTAPFTAWCLQDSSSVNAALTLAPGGTFTQVTSSIGWTNGANSILVGTYDGATAKLWKDGKAAGSAAATGALVYPNAAARGPSVGNYYNFTGGARGFIGRVYLAALWDRAIPDARVLELSDNPWQIFRPIQRRIWVPVSAGGAGITGTGASTLGSFTQTAAGGVRVSGASSQTIGSFSGNAAGSVAVAGSSSAALGLFTGSATGTVSAGGAITGTANQTLGTFTGAAAGVVVVAGAAASTLGQFAGAASGTVAVVGQASQALGSFTGSASGAVAVSGQAAQALAAFSGTAAGAARVSGSSSQALGAFTGGAAGSVGAAPVVGSSNTTLGPFAGSAAGQVRAAGSQAITLGAFSQVATGAVSIAGSGAGTLGQFTQDARGITGLLQALPGWSASAIARGLRASSGRRRYDAAGAGRDYSAAADRTDWTP